MSEATQEASLSHSKSHEEHGSKLGRRGSLEGLQSKTLQETDDGTKGKGSKKRRKVNHGTIHQSFTAYELANAEITYSLRVLPSIGK